MAHRPTQMHQTGSFSRYLKSLVKNELAVARTSSLPQTSLVYHGQEVQPAPMLGHPTTHLEITTIIQELQQHPGAGEEAPSAEGPTGRPCTELEDDLGWKCCWRSSGPIPPQPEQCQPRSCFSSCRTSNPSAAEIQPHLGISQGKKNPFHSCIIHLFISAFTPSRLNLLWRRKSWYAAF